MARIALDTSPTSTTTVKAGFDAINTMTAELYASLGDPSNMVSLGGQALRRTTAYINAPTAADYVTIAFKFRAQWGSAGDTRVLLGDNELFLGVGAAINDSGELILTLRSAGNAAALAVAPFPQVGSLYPYILTAGQTYTVQIVANRIANTVRFWLNGVEHAARSWSTATAALNFSLMSLSSIAASATPNPTKTHTDLLGFFYVGAGTTTDWAITDPTKFYDSGDVYLGPNGQRPNGLQPLVFVGGTHLINDWLAGTNFGYGGNFVLGTG